jgi:hypothetical protein
MADKFHERRVRVEQIAESLEAMADTLRRYTLDLMDEAAHMAAAEKRFAARGDEKRHRRAR